LLLAFSVSVLLPAVLPGLNDAVTPFGKPAAVKLTAPLKPFTLLTLIVLVTLFPRETLRLPGDAERLKSAAGADGFTVRLNEAVWVKVPDVAVTVTVTVPVAAALLAVRVSRLLPVVGFGLNPADTPLGRTEVTANPTVPEKPFNGCTEIVVVPLVPP